MENKALRRFYIDCTQTYFDYRNVGISRVTRKLIELAEVPRTMGYGEVHPVVFCNDRYYVLPNCAIFKDNLFTRYKSVHRIRKYMDLTRYRRRLINMFSQPRASRRLSTDRYVMLKKLFQDTLRPIDETDLSANDFLVLPELVDEIQFPSLIKLKKRLKLAMVVHDLIPITHPEYCAVVNRFNKLCKFTAQNVDVVLAVSQFSASCYEAYEKLMEVSGVRLNQKRIAWFHLGCDFNSDPAPPIPTDEMTEIFSDGVPVYLVCGTIEGRKNHSMVLKVFQELWADGHAIKLLFVGSYGWKAEQTAREITGHPELNKRLFWLTNSSDADLGHAYRKCHAVIFPSQVEGFGLPLVEALSLGKRVIFSRIKSFEEIVPTELLVNSFDPNKPDELLHLLRKSLREDIPFKPSQFKPVTWRQGAEQFYRILAEEPLDEHLNQTLRIEATA